MKYCLGITPAAQYLNKIFQFHQKWNAYFLPPRTEPHITVKSKTGLDESQNWLNQVKKICVDTEPFYVTLTSPFLLNHSTLCFGVKSESLISLHKRILREINITPGPYEGQNFVPHMSVVKIKSGFIEDQDNLQKVAIAELNILDTFLVTKLHVYCSQNDKTDIPYTRIQDILFGSNGELLS